MKTSQPARSSASSAARPPARVERDREPRPPAERPAQRQPLLQERAGAGALEAKKLGDGRRQRPGEVLVGDAEAPQVLLRQVDAPEREVARRVLEEVDELEPRADRVAHRDELGVPGPPVDAEHEAADRVGRVRAVLAHVLPGLVAAAHLVDAVRLDQAAERLQREAEVGDRRVQAAHDLRARRAFQLALELVEQRLAVTGASSPRVSTRRAKP